MKLEEAKQILRNAGYLFEVMGKTNIEDFNKMKNDVYNLTKIPGSNFDFVTGNKKGSVEDERSTMELGWGKGGTYTYDTGRPGFKRYRKLTKEEVFDLIKEKQKEIEELGYNVEFTDDGVKIWMPKSELNIEDERDMTLFGIFNDGGNCWSSRDDENWYWTTSEGETAAEFRDRLRRAGERMAQKNYREYVKSSYGVRVFKNIDDFKAACAKVGLHPNLSDYE